jgi:hypothetical protein
VIAVRNGSLFAGRGLSGNAETILELISSIAGWIRMKDTLVSNTRATIRTDGRAQNTGITIKLCAAGAALDMPRSLVGGRYNIIEGIFSEGGLARGTRLSLADRN